MKKDEVEGYYKHHAKDFVNFLFNKDFLNPHLTRESIDHLEEYCGFLMQSFCETAAKTALLSAKVKKSQQG